MNLDFLDKTRHRIASWKCALFAHIRDYSEIIRIQLDITIFVEMMQFWGHTNVSHCNKVWQKCDNLRYLNGTLPPQMKPSNT